MENQTNKPALYARCACYAFGKLFVNTNKREKFKLIFNYQLTCVSGVTSQCSCTKGKALPDYYEFKIVRHTE
jgi:hypothetical protein